MNRLEHLLVCLSEECDEVGQRAAKALRFTLEEIQPGQSLTNAQRIAEEFHDLIAVVEMLRDEGISIGFPDAETIARKKAKVEKFMLHAAANGALQVPHA